MLSTNYNEKVIGIQGVNVKKFKETEKGIEISIEMERKPCQCPVCEKMTDRIHDYREQTVKDLPSFGRKVILKYRKRRYECECGKNFTEPNPFLPKYQRQTQRKTMEMIDKLADTRSYTSVASEYDVSVQTVIRLFNNISYTKPEKLPEAIGIDEFKGNSGKQKYHCIITDLSNGKVIDILKTRYETALIDYFKPYDRSHVKYFISDMYSTYSETAKTYFKNATYVIDRYHWIRQAIWAFESVRKEAQNKLSKDYRKYFKHSRKLLLKRESKLTDEEKQQVNIMLYASADLLCAYNLKEKLYKILDDPDIQKKKDGLRDWIEDAAGSELTVFERCAKTYRNWLTPILNSFGCSYSNGFTEGCNNKIKVLKRNAFGLRYFPRFRNRILYLF